MINISIITIVLALMMPQKEIKIRLELEHYQNGKLYLLNERRDIDSTNVTNGIAVFTYHKLTNDIENIRIYDRKQKEVKITLLLENEDISITGKDNNSLEYIYTGSQSQNDWVAYNHFLENERKEYDLSFKEPLKADSISKVILEKEHRFITLHPDSYISSQIPVSLLYRKKINKETAFEWFKLLTLKNQQSANGIKMFKMIDDFQQVKQGDLLNLDFILKDLNGKQVKLTDLLGEKDLILIYWASWCGPCLEKIPDLKNFYTKYGNQLQMVSISLDTKEAEWVKSSKAIQLNWLNISDLKGFNSPSATLFDIQGIPKTFWVGKDGRFIKEVKDVKKIEDEMKLSK